MVHRATCDPRTLVCPPLDYILILKESSRNNLIMNPDTHSLAVPCDQRKQSISKYLNFICKAVPTHHIEGRAMKLGLDRALARLEEPEGDEERVSRLGSSSSISSTSSWSSTSWSRMHLTEYWPKTQSWKRRLGSSQTPGKKTGRFLASPTELRSVLYFTYQLLAQLMRRSRLLDRTPSPQSFQQLPYATSLQVTHNEASYATALFKWYAVGLGQYPTVDQCGGSCLYII